MNSLTTRWLRAVHDPGIKGMAVRALLSPLSWLYGAAVLSYRAVYDLGLRKTISPALPTISVGSLSVGGAGKTTVSAFLANRLSAAGCTPALILRGYGRRESEEVVVVSSANSERLVDVATCGDEAAMLAEMCPGAAVVVGRRREIAIEKAASLGAQVAILDDGFEYFRLRRDLDILLVNLLEFGPAMKVLPAGVLRDPPRLLARAGQIWFTYAGAVGDEVINQALDWVQRWASGKPIVATHHEIANFRIIAGQQGEIPAHAKVAAFCGIGSPQGFRAALEAAGVETVQINVFPDHYWYNKKDIEAIAKSAQGAGVDAVVTTWKDAVRLEPQDWPADGPPLMVAEVALKILWGEEHIQEAVGLCQSKG